jgi:hypothetical protein
MVLAYFPRPFCSWEKDMKDKFKDPFVLSPGVLTVGLQNFDSRKGNGIYRMFLALSHLRYYSDPVELDSDNIKTRVIMEQLRLVEFGTLLASWGASIEDVMTIARWFTDLWIYLEKSSPAGEECQSPEAALTDELSWLNVLV